MKSGSWSSYQSAAAPEARQGGERDDDALEVPTMFLLVTQNADLCDVSGYAFETLRDALESAGLRLGISCGAKPANVRIDPYGANVVRKCWQVVELGGSYRFSREGQMTLIAGDDVAAEIAIALTRRNKVHGTGIVTLI